MRQAAVVLSVMLLGSAGEALVTAYNVQPTTASWSGWTDTILGRNFVAQQVTCNFDSVVYCELFVGTVGDPDNLYKAEVRDAVAGTLIARNEGERGQDHHWRRFNLTTMPGQSFTKGKTYSFKFTRASGSDSLQFYYREDSPYGFGSMSVGGTQYGNRDLALRVFGAMRPVRAEDWGFNVGWPDTACTTAVRRRADSAGVSADRFWFGAGWMQKQDTIGYTFPEVEFEWSYDGVGCEMLGLLVGCPKWASTRIDSVWMADTSVDSGFWRLDTSELCPPRGLFASVASDTNYWAGFVRFVVTNAGDRIHAWEAYNEANVIDRFWQRPNTGWYEDYTSDSGMCQLYTRLCIVTDSAVRLVSGHENDLVFVGSMSEVDSPSVAPYRVPGKDWLRMMYHFAGSFRWDGVTVHPYQVQGQPFSPAQFSANADTIRSVMRENDDYGPLWITELGWNTRPYEGQPDSVTEEQQAINFAQVAVAAAAAEAEVAGGYDRVYWWSFIDWSDHFGLLDVGYGSEPHRPKASAFASGHANSALVGKRFSGRVLSGDAGLDTQALTYEFEDPADGRRTWVAWRSGDGADVEVALPAWTDALDAALMDTCSARDTVTAEPALDGWLTLDVSARPVFISEPAATPISRPDLLVDSVGIGTGPAQVGRLLQLKVRFRNTGTDSTNTGNPVANRPNTVVRLYSDTTLVTEFEYSPSIQVGETVRVVLPCTLQARGNRLLRATVNDNQAYVEQDMTNNAGHVRTYVYRPPQAAVDVITPGNGRSDVARVMLNLSSISFEDDSLPCESLLLLQARFGLSDTVPDTIIASGWFGAKACTTWQFLAGEGDYRLALIAADSGGNVSDTAWHDTVGFITFDSTPPAVSVLINSGDAFTNDASVLVSWAGTDSLSPPCSVRLGNAELVNVVAGSGFGTSDTLWRFSGAQADGTSGMVSLPLGVGAAAVWQSLPASAYGALAGHWVRLSADALVQGWSGTVSSVGGLEYGYMYTAEGEQSPDTLFYAAVTVDIPTGPAACIGQDRLEHRFTCPSASTISEYELQAAYVRCLVGGSEADTGFVWLDNLKLERFGPDSEPTFSGWLPPDSVQNWTLSSGDGRKTAWLAVQDVTGNETRTETCDSINLDTTPPVAAIVEPSEGSKVNGEFKLLGWAFDSPTVAGDSWFESYRLDYRYVESEEWTAVDPDSVSYLPAVDPDATLPATLGRWNTEGLEDGEYYVRLTVTDSAGNQSQDETWYGVANGDDGDSENDAAGPDGGGSGLGEGSILVGSATGVLRVYDEELNILSTRTVTDSGQTAYITAAVRHSPDTLILLNARAHTLLALGSTGEPVRLARGLGLPSGLAKDASGAYWLVDKLSGRLARYKRGEGLELISDSLGGPEAVAARGEKVYVADTRGNRIAVYDTTGQELPSITGGFTGPQAIALPEQGGIYLTEPQTGTIKGITSDGTVYYTLGNTTVHKGLLASPDGTKLYTLKPAGNRVLSYRIRSSDSLPGGGQAAGERNLPRTLTLRTPRPNPSNRQTQLSYGLPKASRVSIRLYDAAGRQCANLADCQQKAGWYHLTWDGTGNGRALPAGVYFIQLSTDLGRTQKKLVRTE